jgi:AcrR family transcriptional regulator
MADTHIPGNGARPGPAIEPPNGLAAGAGIGQIQRARLLAAMARAACEYGAANVTVGHVVERAGVSRRTFYELFADGEDCLLAAFDDAVTRAERHVVEHCGGGKRWPERTRNALVALLSFIDREPYLGGLLVVESLAAGPRTLARRRQVVEQFIRALDRDGQELARSGPPPIAAEGVVGGVLGVLHARLSEEPRRPVLDLTSELMSMIVLPYLGPAASRRELERPAPAPSPRTGRSTAPLDGLQMRLTYRTIRVLIALAAEPGSSNRHVAEISGVSDQGQMSKLLARLRQLGLIENANPSSAGRGEPNAWTLTGEGWKVQSVLAQQVLV